VVAHQLQVERMTAKARRPKTDVLPLDHATNQSRLDPCPKEQQHDSDHHSLPATQTFMHKRNEPYTCLCCPAAAHGARLTEKFETVRCLNSQSVRVRNLESEVRQQIRR